MAKPFLSLLVCAFFSINLLAQIERDTEELKISLLKDDWPSVEALSFLDSDTAKYNFFCANEYHRSAMALEQKKAFIRYLKEGKGLDKLVIEFTYAYGYWVNKYLETGDTTLLRIATNKAWSFDKFRKNLEISHDSYSFFKWLYGYSNRYKKKIKVVAIDLDEMHHASLELWTIKQFLLKDSLFIKFTQSYPQLIKIADEEKPNISKVEKWYLTFKPELERNKSVVEKALKSEYEEFNKIAVGVNDVIERYSTKNTRQQREKVLIRNFEREIASTDIIYAQFGDGHLYLKSEHYLLMTEIEKNTIYKGRVLSINIHCEKCELGESRTAYKPYVLFKDSEKGYWWHSFVGNLTDEEHDKLISSLKSNTVIDLRNTKGTLEALSNLFQYLIVLY